MKRIYLLLITMITAFACNNRSKSSISQDFESLAGWFESSFLVKGDAHSGKYFTRTSEGSEYSLTFISTLGNLSDKPLRRIDMGAWVRISEPSANAKLVLSIHSNDSTVFWQAINTEDMSIKPGEWTRLFASYDIPESFPPDYTLKMFLWNVSKKAVDADDFDLQFYNK